MEKLDDFEIIIATRNRAEHVRLLIGQILSAEIQPAQIIIADSSDHPEDYAGYPIRITHVTTFSRNQPYQRYLGYQHASAAYVLYLDDDMEIHDTLYLSRLKEVFESENGVAAVVCRMHNKHSHTSLSNVPGTKFRRGLFRYSLFRWLTANPALPPGKFWWCGVRGSMPGHNGYVEYVNGWAFCARRDLLYRNFNFQLFDLYQRKLGKGEDAITGYTLSKCGSIRYLDRLLFLHNDQGDSVYTSDYFQYARRVSFSRLYLASEYARLNQYMHLKARLIYYWYSLCRMAGLTANLILNPTSVRRRSMWAGTLAGIGHTFWFRYTYQDQWPGK